MKKNLIIALAAMCLAVMALANFSSQGAKTALPETDQRIKAAEVLAGLTRYYQEHPYFSADVEQLAYKDHYTAEQPETVSGHIQAWKSGKASAMMGVQTLENDQFSLSIDTAAAVFMLADKMQQPKLPDIEELERTLQHALNVDVKENAGNTELSLQFDPKEYPIQQMHITVAKNRVSALAMWYAQEVAFDDGSVSKPRIEVRFTNYTEGKKALRKTPELTDYVSTGAVPKIVHPEYLSYQLIDLRTSK